MITIMCDVSGPDGGCGSLWGNMATCEKSSAGPGSSVAVCCPICYREYSDNDSDLVPRILHCGHSFCTGGWVHIVY